MQKVSSHTVKGRAIKELQDTKVFVVTGGAAAAQLTCTGIKVGDTVESVVMYAAGVPSLIALSEVSIPAADKIALSTTNSTSNKLVVTFRPSL